MAAPIDRRRVATDDQRNDSKRWVEEKKKKRKARMKRTTKFALLAALGLAAAGMTTYAQTEPTEPAPAGPPPGPARIGQVLTGILNQYDVNQDGQLDQTEMATLQKDIAEGKIHAPRPPFAGRGPGGPPGHLPKELMDKYDVNQDGVLDETEHAALRKDIDAGVVTPPRMGRGPRGPGGPGFGPPPTAQDVLQKFDADKDSKLDETELSAFLGTLGQHRRGPSGAVGANQQGAQPQQ